MGLPSSEAVALRLTDPPCRMVISANATSTVGASLSGVSTPTVTISEMAISPSSTVTISSTVPVSPKVTSVMSWSGLAMVTLAASPAMTSQSILRVPGSSGMPSSSAVAVSVRVSPTIMLAVVTSTASVGATLLSGSISVKKLM